MDLQALLDWLQHTGVATAIREGAALFPWIESIHVLAITAVVGTIVIVDLRLLGLASRDRPVSDLMGEVLPLTRWAFAAAVVTGSLLFASHAVDYVHKAPFLAKLALLSVALVNIGAFHLVTARNINAWNMSPVLPLSVKLAGGVSLAMWVGIVACGRWTGFV